MNKIEFADTKNPEPTPKGIEYLRNLARNVIVEENNQIEKAIVSIVNNYGDKHILVNAKMIAEAIDKQEKYRWHDLRKDPNDLPPDSENNETTWFECVYINRIHNGFYPHYQFYDGEWGVWLREEFVPLDDYPPVIAWRYIEPFEEEEK